MTNSPVMRSPNAIRLAQELLAVVITDEALRHQVIDSKDQGRALGALEALCWVLGHGGETAPFANFACELTMRLEKLGYQPFLAVKR